MARRALELAGPGAPEAWRLRCLAPLAASGGSDGENAFVEGRQLLEAIDCPPGKAWVPGADCYLQIARAAEQHGDLESAARALAPLRAAVDRSWTPVRELVDAQLGQISSATS